jgi:protein involved in polysaccharide export with SLBB domain
MDTAMDKLNQAVRWLPRTPLLAWIVALCAACGGCTALTNPVADGIPVRLLPPELLGPCKSGTQTIPLSLLRQPEPAVYQLDAGDVLGVFIEGYLGAANQPLPVYSAPPVEVRDQNRLPPGAGYPVPVQEDGTIILPAVAKLTVKGLTVGEAHAAIVKLYNQPDNKRVPNDRIVVTLLYPRKHQVMVFRQEALNFLAGQDGPTPISKRNTGHLVDLPAYHNDVLHALVKTGGLPELDAYNEIIIYRDGMRGQHNKVDAMKQLDKAKAGKDLTQLGIWTSDTIRIPLRAAPGAPLPFGKEDVILRTGDIVFLEARDEQVFFTAGLLPPGKHMLPRDHDLDVIEAVAQVRGSLYNGAFGGSNLAGNLVAPGLGNPSPSLVSVVRRIPGRGQMHIAVDLRSALRHPQERLVIQPGDVLILQEKPAEALARYMSQSLFNFNLFWNVFRSSNGAGVIDIAAPDRLPTRVGAVVLPTN